MRLFFVAGLFNIALFGLAAKNQLVLTRARFKWKLVSIPVQFSFPFFLKIFWRTQVLFVGSLIPLFFPSSDVCHGFHFFLSLYFS